VVAARIERGEDCRRYAARLRDVADSVDLMITHVVDVMFKTNEDEFLTRQETNERSPALTPRSSEHEPRTSGVHDVDPAAQRRDQVAIARESAFEALEAHIATLKGSCRQGRGGRAVRKPRRQASVSIISLRAGRAGREVDADVRASSVGGTGAVLGRDGA